MHITTLVDFRPGKLYQADDGMPGRTKEQDGKNAQDMILEVPVGTLIIDRKTQIIIWQVLNHGDQYLVAPWGRSGIWNMHFKSSTRQYPNFALKWEPGIYKEIKLELQLIADIALIGTPSVGKSSIINILAHTRAKVADYPFTTLVPNLGTIQAQWRYYHVIDIPWLIQGAHTGKWLGNAFLRHILKANILAVVLDIDRWDMGMQEFDQTIDELIAYIQDRYDDTGEFGISLTHLRVQIIVDTQILLQILVQDPQGQEQILWQKVIHIIVNKIDLVQDQDIIQEYLNQLSDHITHYLQNHSPSKITKNLVQPHIHTVSTMLPGWCDKLKTIRYDIIADKHLGQNQYIDQITGIYQSHIDIDIQDVTDTKIDHLINEWYLSPEQSRYLKVWSIVHPEICRLANILPRSNEQAEQRFWKQCMRQKLTNRFEKNGVRVWDILHIISVYPGTDDMYITYE